MPTPIPAEPTRRVHTFTMFLLALLCSLGAGCAARPVSDSYRIVYHGGSQYVYPPGTPVPKDRPLREVSVQLSAPAGAGQLRDCAVSEGGLRMERDGSNAGHWVAEVSLPMPAETDFEPSPEDTISHQVRAALEKLAASNCFGAEDIRSTTAEVFENLPLRFSELLPTHYNYVRGGSAIDLSSGSRLKVQQAVFRDTPELAATSEPASPLENYSGTITAYYEVREGNGRVSLRRTALESDVFEDSRQRRSAETRLARLDGLASRYLRLVFLGLMVRDDTERKAVLLASSTSGELERMSEAVLVDPAGLCEAAAPENSSVCIPFDGTVSTEVEIQVRLNGEYRYVLLGTPLEALAPRDAKNDDGVFSKLKLRRRHGGKLVPLRTGEHPKGALQMPLLAHDEVEW